MVWSDGYAKDEEGRDLHAWVHGIRGSGRGRDGRWRWEDIDRAFLVYRRGDRWNFGQST